MSVLDAVDVARQYISRENVIKVCNFGFDRAIIPLHYNPVGDLWTFSDGEVYSTNAIVKELDEETRPCRHKVNPDYCYHCMMEGEK